MKFLFIKFCLFFITVMNMISQEVIISGQSQSQVVCKGSLVELWVDAEGKSLEYEWFFNNVQLIGAKHRILTIENFDYSKTGTYYCYVKSHESFNSTKSSDIQIYIATETLFIKRPENVMFQQGGIAEFKTKIHANQDSIKNITLQWYFWDGENPDKFDNLKKLNGNNRISGTKSELLSISNLNAFDKGIYVCVAEGKCGNDTTFAFLNDNIYFKLKNLTKGYYDCTGGDAVLEVEVTNYIGGELDYQWFNPGLKPIMESKKFIGTKTKKLIIKNVQMSDNNAYYLKVTHKESGYFARSDHFYVEPDMLPIIRMQPKDYLVKDREATPTNYGQTYVGVFVDNLKPCTFKWYRNDTLVRTTYGIGMSDYFLGGNNTPRKAQLTDVGVYQCEIINECGTSWTKKVRVIWGLDDANYCEKSDAILTADSVSKDTNLFKYFWFYNNQLITDNNKYKNATSNQLIVNNIDEKDRGSYHAYLQATNGGLTYYLGKVFLNVFKAPEITKQLPDTMFLSGKWIKKAPIVVRVLSPTLSYQYFNKNDEAITNIVNKRIYNLYEEYQIFYHGGYDFTMEDGTYYIKFWNDCGETKSNYFTISHSEKPSGILLDSNFISSNRESSILSPILYPSPSSDFINIKSENTLNIEDNQLEIFNICGDRVDASFYHFSEIYNQKVISVDIRKLSSGIYFLKIGEHSLKFIKID